MNKESLLKGRIAECIVETLFEENGYLVQRLGYEGLLLGISRNLVKKLDKTSSGGKITTAPSIAVFDNKGTRVTLLKIKFKGPKSKGGNIYHGFQKLQEYWPEALLLVVDVEDPCFNLIIGSEQQVGVEKYFPNITKNSLQEAEGLVKKYLN